MGQHYQYKQFEIGYVIYPLGGQFSGISQMMSDTPWCEAVSERNPDGGCKAGGVELRALPLELYARFYFGPAFVAVEASYGLIPVIEEGGLSDEARQALPPFVEELENNNFIMALTLGISS